MWHHPAQGQLVSPSAPSCPCLAQLCPGYHPCSSGSSKAATAPNQNIPLGAFDHKHFVLFTSKSWLGERGKVFSSRSGCELLAEPLSPWGMGSSDAPAKVQRGSCDDSHLTHLYEWRGQQHKHSVGSAPAQADVVLLMPQPSATLLSTHFLLQEKLGRNYLFPALRVIHVIAGSQGAAMMSGQIPKKRVFKLTGSVL